MKTISPSSSAYAYPLLIKQLLATPLAIAAEQEIVYRGTVRHSYHEFNQRIHRGGGALLALGVKADDTVAVMDWDSHRYLESYFTIPMLGATLMTVNVRLTPAEIQYCLHHCGASTLLVHADFLPLLAQIKAQLPNLKHFVLLRDHDTAASSLPADFAGEYEALLEHAVPLQDFPDFDENTRATCFYTTGTTGEPKGVQFSHRQLVLHTLATTAALAMPAQGQRFHQADVYMPLTPMFHVHGWGIPYVATLMGVKQVYPGRYVPDVLVELIQKERVTFSHCVPTVLQMLLQAANAKTADFSRWKVVIGGSALTAGLCTQARERGIDIFAGYGMSETCPLLTLAQLATEAGSLSATEDVAVRTLTGRPVPLVHLRVVDSALQDVPHDGKSTGEVVVRSPWLTQAYLGNADASEKLWEGGWLHTQDIGHINPQGYLCVTDRIKDVIKTGGEWISSLQLENLINQHPAVAEVAVIGIPDEKWGERALSIIVPKNSPASGQAEQLTIEAIRAHLQQYVELGIISSYAIPREVKIVEAIVKTSVGKPNKKLMREKYAQGVR